ncbi:hypothetical protein L3X38_030877 [Prunus dulcis]|uniref:Uncharacterized protein n=1 Tax=Prunus dulcis TaxID=3755 RepID=A0AAD4YUF1_PRUDU|nr:hypothetical protein L3X38_030877 [Prunus dulcis]
MFLDRLHHIYDSIRSEILRTVPFPDPESDFATVHRVEQRRHTMLSLDSSASMAMMAVTTRSSALTQNRIPLKPSFENKNGYPDWWEAFQEKKTRDAQERPLRRDDKATMVTGYVAPPPLAADMSGATHAVLNSHLSSPDPGWIIDSGATDHMTYDPSLLRSHTTPHCSSVTNANGVAYPVTSSGTDIGSQEIIGRGTKNGDSTMWMMFAPGRIMVLCMRQRVRTSLNKMVLQNGRIDRFWKSHVLASLGEILGVEELNWMVLFPDSVDLASHTGGVSTSSTPTESNHPALEDPAPVTLSEMLHPEPASGDVVYSSPLLLLLYMTKKSLMLIRLSDKFQLPPRSTRGKPLDRYSPDTFKTVKYPMFIAGGTMISPTVFAMLMLLDDGTRSSWRCYASPVINPEWPTSFYLQAAALKSLGMDNDAQETLNDGASLEVKKNKS